MVTYSNVSARALLVSLSISMWTGYKLDKKATNKVNADHNASNKAGRYNKQLLPGAKVFEDLRKRSALARDVHYEMTLPWADEGWRLLTTANYFAYTDKMREQFRLLDSLKHEFFDTYDDLVEASKAQMTALGQLFNEHDYPTRRTLAHKYHWALDFKPVPSGGDVRVDLPADQLSEIEARITEQVERATRDAMNDAWKRLHEAVARIQRASGEDGVVRNNLLDHAKDVVDLLGRLNVADDENLEEFRNRVERELTTIAVEDLRKDARLRKDTEKRATDIMSAMSAFYTPFEPNGDVA